MASIEEGLRTWRSWSGLTTAQPAQVMTPADEEEVADAVVAARTHGLGVKMVGSGHSFTDIAVTGGLMLRPEGLVGIRSVDRSAMTVTVLAGTPLHVLNEALDRLGLALHNMGDVDRQTVAGAISTGTHGTGGHWASLSAQVAGVELVDGSGRLVTARADGTPEEVALLRAARVGLGALGVLTAVTFWVEPAFALEAVEAPMSWDAVVDGFDGLADGAHHFEAYWFPHTDRMLTKTDNRTLDDLAPLSRTRARTYTIKNEGQQKLILDYYEQAAIPALNRAGSKNIGVFTELKPSDPAKIYVVIPFKSMNDFAGLESEIIKRQGLPAGR